MQHSLNVLVKKCLPGRATAGYGAAERGRWCRCAGAAWQRRVHALRAAAPHALLSFYWKHTNLIFETIEKETIDSVKLSKKKD